MKGLGVCLAGVLAAAGLAGCGRGHAPETVVSEYLDFHQPGVWTPVVIEHLPFLDYKASEATQRRLDTFLANRLAWPEGEEFERE